MEVRIEFDAYTFRYFDVTQNCWQTEAGTYEVLVGASSEDIRLSASVTKEGVSIPCNPNDNLSKYHQADVKHITSEEFEALLGRKIPSQGYTWEKDGKHIHIGDNQTVSDLKYAKGWIGRLFAGGIHLAHKFLVKTGKKTTANTVEMGMFHQPMRALAQFGGMSQSQYEGMLQVFNGHTLKGVRQFLKKS